MCKHLFVNSIIIFIVLFALRAWIESRNVLKFQFGGDGANSVPVVAADDEDWS